MLYIVIGQGDARCGPGRFLCSCFQDLRLPVFGSFAHWIFTFPLSRLAHLLLFSIVSTGGPRVAVS